MYILLENQLSRGGYEIPLTVLTPPHLCVCPKQGIGFPTSYVGVFFYVQSPMTTAASRKSSGRARKTTSSDGAKKTTSSGGAKKTTSSGGARRTTSKEPIYTSCI
jgi:hypothetical protein